jgi:hypothetical protein
MKSRIAHELSDWRTDWDPKLSHGRVSKETLFDALDDGLRRTNEIFALGASAAESNRAPFNDVSKLMKLITSPPNWNWGGVSFACDFPRALAFVFNYLYGATSMAHSSFEQAARLAVLKLPPARSGKQAQLFLHGDLTGSPATLGGNVLWAREYLARTWSTLGWLKSLFVTEASWVDAVDSYSFLICVCELAVLLTYPTGTAQVMSGDGHMDAVPLFAYSAPNIYAEPCLSDEQLTLVVSKVAGIEPEKLRGVWPTWVARFLRPSASGLLGPMRFFEQPPELP